MLPRFPFALPFVFPSAICYTNVHRPWLHSEASPMRLILLALLISAGPMASGQTSPSASQSPNPAPCKPALQFISPSSSPCLDLQSPMVPILPAAPPNLNRYDRGLTDRGQPQVKPALPAQLTARRPNQIQLLALNNLAPPPAPSSSPRGKAEPIPTTWPNAHVEKIPTNWPGLKLLLIDQPPPANKPAESKIK